MMPNTGKPSLACHLCRKRRVKCDLSQPECLRCKNLGKSCPGYRDEQGLLFRNQYKVSFAAKRASALVQQQRQSTPVSDGWGKSPTHRAGKRSLSSGCIIVEASQANLPTCSISALLPPQVGEHWRLYCIPIVLHHFSAVVGGNRVFGHFDFLPDLYRESNKESCFLSATTAVAKAYITNLSHAPADTSELAQIYGYALKSVNAALKDPLERVKDSTLIAVWLLGIHEILISSPKKPPETAPEAYHMHSQGLASLLRVRGPHQFSSRRGRNLFWIIYMFIQTHCLVGNIEGPSQSLQWFDLLQPQLSEDEQFAFAVSKYTYRISLLYPRILSIIRSPHTDFGRLAVQVTSLLTEVDSLQAEIQAWDVKFAFRSAELTSLQAFNNLRAAVLKLHHFIIILISCTKTYPESVLTSFNFSQRRQECTTLIQLLSAEILNSVPFVLGDSAVDPDHKSGCWAAVLRLLWPLVVVSWVPSAMRRQRDEAQLALQHIGRQMGIRLALECEPPPGRFTDNET